MSHEGEGNAVKDCDTSNNATVRCDSETVRVQCGNPALGTYGGCVVFAPSEEENVGSRSSNSNTDDDDVDVEEGKTLGAQRQGETTDDATCLAAMVQVPPEQVPEGVLTLARAHRKNIFHVRIAISKGGEGSNSFDSKNDDGPKLDLDYRRSVLDGENDNQTLSQSTYLVLFELHTPEAADLFVNNLNGKPFTSLVPDEVCHVRRVMKVDGDDGVDIMSPFFAAHRDRAPSIISSEAETPPLARAGDAEPSHFKNNVNNTSTSAMDIQNCAVCLEPMETMHLLTNNSLSRRGDSTAAKRAEPILTTVCNHSFHINCLLKWQDSPCPVCRYDHSGLNSETLSECHLCGTKENNYVCLICGVVSCAGSGRSSCSDDARESEDNLEQESESSTTCEHQHPANRGHARAHYEQTLHTYALETENQYVWDFAGGGYVHRLIRNSEDGKLVEINDPRNTTSNERSTHPSYISDAQEEEAIHRKLEDFAGQYSTLLKSQLERQRIYYEGRLTEMKRERSRREETEDTTKKCIAAFKQKRHQLQQRYATLQRKHETVSEKLSFLKNTNESLDQNKTLLDEKLETAKKEQAVEQSEMQQTIATLEEKVARLMQKLDSPEPGSNDSPVEDDRKPSAK
jgi:BRCA1-associated protein